MADGGTMTIYDTVSSGAPPDGQAVWVAMPADASRSFPPLQAAARPVAQDRWERLVSEVTISASATRVWAALVEAESIAQWLAVCRGEWAVAGRECTLDFEDGEFFYCRTETVEPAGDEHQGTLSYLWRWVGIGPATSVCWVVTPRAPQVTTVTVTEESTNPPSDWRSWNGMGWPGILDQLARHLRTGTSWRWPWRRMGPYVQVELAAPPFEAWEALTSNGAIKHWLQRSRGALTPGDPMTLTMGDASGTALLEAVRVVDAGQEFPSYLPYVEFTFRRPAWQRALGGRLWIEPAGLGRSLLQVFLFNWEALGVANPLEERHILTGFWVTAFGRAQAFFAPTGLPPGPHGWSS